jgi:hypothetical protein
LSAISCRLTVASFIFYWMLMNLIYYLVNYFLFVRSPWQIRQIRCAYGHIRAGGKRTPAVSTPFPYDFREKGRK